MHHSFPSCAGDAEVAVRQLVEVAVRALSSGINDPHTAMSVLDRLGAKLCDMARHERPGGVTVREGAAALVVPVIGYERLVNVMFHFIRQIAAGNTAVLIRLLDVLTAAVVCEPAADRKAVLARHADLTWSGAVRGTGNPSDLADVHRRHHGFQRAADAGILALVGAGAGRRQT